MGIIIEKINENGQAFEIQKDNCFIGAHDFALYLYWVDTDYPEGSNEYYSDSEAGSAPDTPDGLKTLRAWAHILATHTPFSWWLIKPEIGGEK